MHNSGSIGYWMVDIIYEYQEKINQILVALSYLM